MCRLQKYTVFVFYSMQPEEHITYVLALTLKQSFHTRTRNQIQSKINVSAKIQVGIFTKLQLSKT